MELRILQYFLMVAREENITRAAKQLNMTQPTLSRQLMQLEDELGKPLFIRGIRIIELRDDGVLVCRRAEEILSLVNKRDKEITQSEELMVGNIMIGTGIFCSSQTFLSNVIEEFHEEYPLVKFDIYTGNADLIKERIDQGLVDIGILLEPVDISKYNHIRIPLQEKWGVIASKENKLAFEKEVLGVYISGHPLEEHEERWRRMISATTADFQFDEELNRTKVHDGEKSVVGGMIVDKTVKYTKTNQVMAFLTLEDLLGTVEVVIFPRDYEKNRQWLEINEKVFISGRVSEEDEKASKLICEKVIPFERTKRELWIQFPDKETFLDEEQIVYGYLADSEGEDEVIIYCAKERAVKRLPKNRNIQINDQVLIRLMNHFG